MALGFRLAQLQPLVLTWGVNYLMEDLPPYLSSSLYIHLSIKKKHVQFSFPSDLYKVHSPGPPLVFSLYKNSPSKKEVQHLYIFYKVLLLASHVLC